VLVVAEGSLEAPSVLARRRVELVDGGMPRQPYHAAAEGGLSLTEASRLIGQVERAAQRAAATAARDAARRFGATVAAVVGGGRAIPRELERVLASHPLLHAAEGALYEEAIAEAARASGLDVRLVPPGELVVAPAVDTLGRVIGAPWQKDHKLAAAAALGAVG
jgi:hypothetical protein